MNKIVSLINFVNDTDPPLNDTNLNQMDRELDELDDRVIAMETDVITQAENAEAWAEGTRGGDPVDPTDPTYNHNAKYHAEQAANSATAAGNSETNAGASATAASNSASSAAADALKSEGYANGNQNGVPAPGTEYENNNSKHFRDEAQSIVADLLAHYGVNVAGTELVFGATFSEHFSISVVGTQLVIANI
jgi:hypothetical protein